MIEVGSCPVNTASAILQSSWEFYQAVDMNRLEQPVGEQRVTYGQVEVGALFVQNAAAAEPGHEEVTGEQHSV